MRKIVAAFLAVVLLMGSTGLTMARGEGFDSAELSQKWAKFSEKIKSNKISPYLKLGVSSNSVKVIVQTKVQPLFQQKLGTSQEEKLQQQISLNQLRSEITKISPKIKVEHTFTKLFTGFALSVPANKVSSLALVSNVQSIHPVMAYKALGSPSKVVGADKVWGMKDAKGAPITGKGIKVGIVDTGIDYNHPDLKMNYKGGYNAVGKNNDPKDGHGHGTHVAGIIAANGKMKGIAPDASIYSYRVLNNNGRGTNVEIIAGIEKAAEDQVDVMNLSLGSSANIPDDPLALALNKIVQLGITVAVANGNDGGDKWTVGTPATAEGVISVGASSLSKVTKSYSLEMNNPLDKGNPIQVDVEYLSKSKTVPGTKWEVVDVGFGGSIEDYKGKNVRGKMVLVKESADWGVLIANAQKAGAAAIISEGMTLPKAYEKSSMAIFAAGTLDRKVLKKAMKSGANVFCLKQSVNNTPEEVADFSSRGMVQGTWAVKPDVVAPGVHIKSTIPKGKYDSWDGTSMASPQVAGAAVLVKQMHPDWKPVEIKAALSNTARDLVNPLTGKSYHVKEQGSGRIDIPRAINTTTLVTPNNVSFGLINPVSKAKEKKAKESTKKGTSKRAGKKPTAEESNTVQVERTITVKNMSKVANTYQTCVDLVNGHKGTKVSIPSQIKVGANSTKAVSFKVTIDPTMPRGIYTGRLYLRDKSNEQYVVPFTFCIDPKSYARINYLDLSEEFISPKSKNRKSSTEVSYFIPNAVQYVTLYLSGDKLKPTIIHEAKNVTSGTKKFQWDGTLNGKPVADGVYTLEAVAKDGTTQDTTSSTVYVYSCAPKLTSKVNPLEGSIKLEVEHELAVLSYNINSFLSIFGMRGEDFVKVQYQLQGSDKWVSMPLAKGRLKKKQKTEEDLTGKIELTITPPYTWMRGPNDIVTIRATDKAGNQSKIKVKIEK